jgi:hypothetical protein
MNIFENYYTHIPPTVMQIKRNSLPANPLFLWFGHVYRILRGLSALFGHQHRPLDRLRPETVPLPIQHALRRDFFRGCDIEQISTVGGNRRAEIFDADADWPVFAAFGVFGLKRSEAILTRNGLHDKHGFICSFHTGKFFLLMMTS